MLRFKYELHEFCLACCLSSCYQITNKAANAMPQTFNWLTWCYARTTMKPSVIAASTMICKNNNILRKKLKTKNHFKKRKGHPPDDRTAQRPMKHQRNTQISYSHPGRSLPRETRVSAYLKKREIRPPLYTIHDDAIQLIS